MRKVLNLGSSQIWRWPNPKPAYVQIGWWSLLAVTLMFWWMPSAIAFEEPSLDTSPSLTADIMLTAPNGVGGSVGTITLEDTEYGLLLTPDLTDLPTGLHGFHVHANPDCGPAEKDGKSVPGLAAGGHFDPTQAGEHQGPYREGHLGDLPPLYVNESGIADVPVLAPRLLVSQTTHHSLTIHAGGDNFSNDPAPLGGGGARLACGVLNQT